MKDNLWFQLVNTEEHRFGQELQIEKGTSIKGN